ncbi:MULTISPECIES: hypothetical protein [Niastella]|uniref:Uncharacterized protein n=1 Tax=Niastella soli TaxID=2821487 RepID=A0ABS3Z1K8_9BACT|nr:hypothetical protein [Niastella soli]MBO9204038.1 hypothetical protein [Niastella soli]
MKHESVLSLFLFIYLLLFCMCSGKDSKIITPDKFINNVVVNKDDYLKDSLLICERLKIDLLNHERFFNNTAYFEMTEIIIDTIIYYGDLKKMAAFIIVKNPSYRQLYPDKTHRWYYEGTSYLGKKMGDSLSLSWIGPSFSNSINKAELSKILRDYYFMEYATMDASEPTGCKYNLNDMRFGDCVVNSFKNK